MSIEELPNVADENQVINDEIWSILNDLIEKIEEFKVSSIND